MEGEWMTAVLMVSLPSLLVGLSPRERVNRISRRSGSVDGVDDDNAEREEERAREDEPDTDADEHHQSPHELADFVHRCDSSMTDALRIAIRVRADREEPGRALLPPRAAGRRPRALRGSGGRRCG